MKQDFLTLYQQLKGQTHERQGGLHVKGFTSEEEYEDLYYYILEVLSPVIDGDYEYFYNVQARRYYRHKQRKNKTDYFYCPQVEKPFYAQTIREQLALLKWYIYRKADQTRR